MTEMSADHRDKLISDLRTVISDAEEVLRVTADTAGEGASQLRERMTHRLHQAKDRMGELQSAAVAHARAAGHAADDYVHDHPWRVIGAACGVGLIFGLLIGRR